MVGFVWHPKFQDAMKEDDFKNWKQEGLDWFNNFGSGRSMYPKEVILQKIGDTGRLDLQYRQVRAFVLEVIKKSNVFRPRTMFEILLSSGEKSKLLSKLYNK